MPAIEIIKGDITKITVDAIVNAANTSLMGVGGVDGAIHRAGGPEILEDCRRIVARQGGCPTGKAVITTAGQLSAKYVIHTVGPVWRGGNIGEADLLRQCYIHSLDLASKHQCKSIAFPNISTGIYGFPKDAAASIAYNAINNYDYSGSSLEQIVFVCFDKENYDLLRGLVQDGFLKT